MSMAAVRTQQLRTNQENSSKSVEVKSVEGQKTARHALGDITNASKEVRTAAVKSSQKKSKKRKGPILNAHKDIDFTAEKEYMPKCDTTNNLAFDTEFIPSSYFNDLISALKSTPYPMISELAEKPKRPCLPSLTLDTATRPDDKDIMEEVAALPPLDLPPLDLPPLDIPDNIP